jgi:hypothetical protein
MTRVSIAIAILAAGCSVQQSPPPPVAQTDPKPAPLEVKIDPKAAPPKAPALAPAAKAPASPPARAAVLAKPASPPPLDLTALESRLRSTPAIGTFTKLALKNEVDDLLAKFRAFHQGKAAVALQQLRQSYELLIMKVLSLLQDGDPPLARSIADSREALWSILSDKSKFATI